MPEMAYVNINAAINYAYIYYEILSVLKESLIKIGETVTIEGISP